jgi:hypothetical protein
VGGCTHVPTSVASQNIYTSSERIYERGLSLSLDLASSLSSAFPDKPLHVVYFGQVQI